MLTYIAADEPIMALVRSVARRFVGSFILGLVVISVVTVAATAAYFVVLSTVGALLSTSGTTG